MSLITILGASGFIGSALARKVIDTGLTCKTPERNERLTGTDLGHVIYCAGLTADFRSRPFETVEAHVCHLLHVLRDCEFQSLVYLSSTRVYRKHTGSAREEDHLPVNSADPDDLYGISKLMGESLAVACGRKIKIVRLSNVYGADFASENFLSTIIRDAVSKKQVMVHSSPDSEKDYVSLDDVVDSLIKIALGGQQNIYNVASGVNVSNLELTQRLSELTGCRIAFDPLAVKQSSPRISIDRVRSEFGFQPSSVLADLVELIKVYKTHYDKEGRPG